MQTLHLRGTGPAHLSLACQVQDCLADCYQVEGSQDLETEALKTGIALCEECQDSCHRCVRVEWVLAATGRF